MPHLCPFGKRLGWSYIVSGLRDARLGWPRLDPLLLPAAKAGFGRGNPPRCRARTTAVLHQLVLLGAGQQVRALGLANRHAGREPGVSRRAQRVGVEADLVAALPPNLPAASPAVAQVDGDGAVGVTRHDPDGRAHRRIAETQLDDVRVKAAVLAAVGVAAEGDAQFQGRGRAEDGRIVPGNGGDRLGHFLEPAVVGKATVVDCRVRLENELVTLRCRSGRAARRADCASRPSA